MAKRHRDALAIQGGACNPSGIAHSIVDACQEFRSEKHDTLITADPAIRLMVHQLAFICGVTTGVGGFEGTGIDGHSSQTWEEAMAACRKADQEDKLVPMNDAQLVALKKVYDRCPIFATEEDAKNNKRQTFDEFRATVQPGPGCVMVPWAGMVLGIEPDGYTHS